MILNCQSKRGLSNDSRLLGFPVVTCQAKWPECGAFVWAVYLGHFPNQELPKQIEHECRGFSDVEKK